ncbi:MAG: hypothetical protein GKR89_32940 [Candidatus Latescibacteria bacterium]|nr:hypothetical protein [Candidatus Latescibacterota bacterium]
MKIRVAGAQIPVLNDIEANIAALERALEFAKNAGADILLTPEGSLSGYTPHFDRAAAEEGLRYITGKARDNNLGLALGTCYIEPGDQRCYNQIRFYRPDGHYLGFHSKTLTCGTMTDPPRGEIEDYAVAPLQTYTYGDIPIGGLICNDLWANPACTPMPDPHLTQQLADRGARIVFHAVNGGRGGDQWSEVNWRYHEANLCMRARAGGLWIVTVDNCHPPTMPCSSPSGVVDPQGQWACRTEPEGEHYFVYTIELD